jgi:hypothetical protein
VGTYPCSNCGERADTASGCPNCGRPVEQEISELNKTITAMQFRNMAMVDERGLLMKRLQGAIATRALLQQAVSQRAGVGGAVRRVTARTSPGPAGTAPVQLSPPPKRTARKRAQQPISRRLPDGTVTITDRPIRASKTVPIVAPPEDAPPVHPPEASTRSMQNILLGLGALLFAVTALALSGYLRTTLGTGGRFSLFLLLTIALIAGSLPTARQSLLATAETIATVGLLFVLLDGYLIWTSGWLAGSGLTPAGYAGLVMLFGTAIAAGYRWISHLIAPRFAAVVLLQPVIPLLVGSSLVPGLAGWAVIFGAVGALDMAVALLLANTRDPRREGTPYLLEAAWGLHALGVLAGAVCSGIALARAHTVTEALAGAAGLLLAASVGLGGGLILRRRPLPDLAGGLLTLAVIGAAGRLAAIALPGRGLVLTAVAILATAFGIRYVTPVAKRGAQIGGALAAAGLGVLLLVRGFDSIKAPLEAATPAWKADLSRYPSVLAHAAGTTGWQLVIAALLLTLAVAIMVPVGLRTDSATVGATLALLFMPAGFALSWTATSPVLLLGAVGAGAVALVARRARSTCIRVGAALVLGLAATQVALARASAAALILAGIVLAGVVIGSLPRLSPVYGRYAQLAADTALAGAAFALPGAIAFGTIALAPAGTHPTPILAASFLATAGTLCAVAVAQASEHAASPILASGATLGAGAVAVATLVSQPTSFPDLGVALLLLIAGLALLLAPNVVPTAAYVDPALGARPTSRLRGAIRYRAASRLTGSDIAAVLVTTAAVGTVARVASLIVPRYALATIAVLVLLLAFAIYAMPPEWRRGPRVGGSLIASAACIVATIGAVRGAIEVLSALPPIWHTDLANWSVSAAPSYGAQTPIALLLLSLAAAVALPTPWSKIASIVGLGLAALAAPAGFSLGWWSPILLSGAVATGAGWAAAKSLDPRVAWARGAVATVLFVNTVAASLVAPETTAATLVGSTAIFAGVAAVASMTRRRHEEAVHLIQIGGASLAGAIVTLPAAAICAAYSRNAPQHVWFTAGFAALCLCLGLVGLACYNDETLLPYATGGIAVAGTAITIGTVNTPYPTGVYAAGTALLVVLAELLHVAVIGRRATLSGAGLRAADSVAVPRRIPLRPGYTILLAAAPVTAIALVELAPSVAATVFGPYQWLGHVWSGAPATANQGLDGLSGWIGHGNEVVTAVLLTIAAALGALGLGGDQRSVTSRAVAVLIPGIAVTLLIAPAVLRMPWAAGPLAALAVSAIAGLAVALTAPPPDTIAARPLRRARVFVVVICAVAGGAGIAGGLANREMTLVALCAAVACGLFAALYGLNRVPRIVGWLVTATAGHLLALVIGLIAGLPVYWSAFLVAGVASGLLVLAALLPRMQRATAVNESGTVEATAYAGAVLALLLASTSLPHLAVFCTAWGAVLGVAASRPGRPRLYRSTLIWFAAGHEVVAWWLLMRIGDIALPEAYTLAVAVVATITGYVEYRRHPEISSWYAYGIALVSAFLPSLAIVIATGETPLRRLLLILASAATVALGSVRRQQAPVVVGGVVLTAAALHELAVLSTVALLSAVMGLVGVLLALLGANYEKRRRNIARLRGAIGRLR